MRLIRVIMCLSLSILLAAASGCANLKTAGIGFKDDKIVPIENPKTLTIIIPNNPNVTANTFTNVQFRNRTLNSSRSTMINPGSVAKQTLIRFKNVDSSTFTLEKRIDNGTAGSGLMYTVNYTLNNDSNNTILELKPTQYKTYQQGLISFDVPPFSEDEAFSFIASNKIGYKLEIDSQYNTESIFANFDRLATKVRFRKGEKDSVTGKIFKNRFSVNYKDEKIYFSVETFPYRNGSKAVINVEIPGVYTSENTVDFNVILNEVKTQLESIVNS